MGEVKKRCIVKFIDGNYVNIQATRLSMMPNDTNMMVVENGSEIVGVFDLGGISAIYLSEKGE